MPTKADQVRHIVAMGGGGFAMEPENPLLDDFVLGLVGKSCPRVCFVGTASGDSENFVGRFHEAFPSSRAVASDLGLFRRDDRNLEDFLLSQDVIYVGGGNTANMLMIWRLHGVDRILRRAWERGIILTGLSAGMICWFQCGVTDSFGPLAPLDDGMGFLSGSACPHYDGEPERRPSYHRFIRDRSLPAGVAADVGAAIHYVGTEMVEVISSRPSASAYAVELKNGQVTETPLQTRFLGARETSE